MRMKVTVCFGGVKVVVPCGEGDLTIDEVIDKATTRYRKAIGKPSGYWITVHSLQSISDGGILDPDDQIQDVADDREKLLANFEEQDGPRLTHSIGDGTSASSAGTASPDMFHSENIINTNNSNKSFNGCDVCEHNQMDVVVTDEHINAGTSLHVRRGSEPSLIYTENNNSKNHDREEERWGSEEILDDLDKDRPSAFERLSKARSSFDGLDSNSAFSRFGRDSKRQSMTGTAINKFISTQQTSQSDDRTEPVGESSKSSSSAVEMETEVINIHNDGSPLGVHIVPFVENADGTAFGMVVYDIDQSGRAARDGRLRPGDHIIAIDAYPIYDESFDSAQELMKEAMKVSSVALKIEREKFDEEEEDKEPMTNGIDATPEVPIRAPSTTLSTDPASPTRVKNIIAPTNTRRIGRKLYIQLMKGPQGLGFSVTTRDNIGAGTNPIYIKNILPKGAAIADGRLKAGDRLLEVNGIEMTGKTQMEAVTILRSVKLGGVVNLVVSRQESSPNKFLPRPIEEVNSVDETLPKNKQILNLDIELNDTGSAGLGVSVKGKTAGTGSNGETKDLGIFIKSVIHGGAASKDGRLRPNDQLLCINAVSLLNKSNSEAMETLRKAMCAQQLPNSKIRLIIARRVDSLNDSGNESSLNKSKSIESLNADHPVDYPDREVGVDAPISPPISTRRVEITQEREITNRTPSVPPQHVLPNKYVPNRTQSYQIATQSPPPSKYGGMPPSTHSKLMEEAPTITGRNGEVFLIEDYDLDSQRYHSSVMPESQSQQHSQEPPPRSPSPPQWVLDWAKGQSSADDHEREEDRSPGLTDFNRDSFARRSFSERKHGGSLDAQQLNWYNKTRSASKERKTKDTYEAVGARSETPSGKMTKSNSSESLLAGTNLTSYHHTAYEDYYPKLKPKSKSFAFMSPSEKKDLGPYLGMKKSSSFESLLAAVADYTSDNKSRQSRTSAKVIRGRVCNESFRAAVDRSYGDTLDRKDVKENGGLKMMAKSEGALDNRYIGDASEKPMRSSKKKAKDKRKSGVLKGLGSMFRFGKNRKSEVDGKEEDGDAEEGEEAGEEMGKPDDEDRRKSRQEAEDAQERIEEQHKRLRDQEAEKKREEGREAMSKAERMLQLREQHQKKHRERNGRYKDDEDDDDDDDEEEYRKEPIYSKSKHQYRERAVDDHKIYHEYKQRKYENEEKKVLEDDIYDTRKEHVRLERSRSKSYDPYDRYDDTRHSDRRPRYEDERKDDYYDERHISKRPDEKYRNRYNGDDRYVADGRPDNRKQDTYYYEKDKKDGIYGDVHVREERKYEDWQRKEVPYEQRYRDDGKIYESRRSDDARIYESRRSQKEEKMYDVPRYKDTQRERERRNYYEEDMYDRIGERKRSKEYSERYYREDDSKRKVERKNEEPLEKTEKHKKSSKDVEDKKLERVDSKDKNEKKLERKGSKDKIKRTKSLERKGSKEKEKEEKKLKKLQRSESKEKMKKEKAEKSKEAEKIKQGRDKSKERLNEKSSEHKESKRNGSLTDRLTDRNEKVYESYKKLEDTDHVYESRQSSRREERSENKSRHQNDRTRRKDDDNGFYREERRHHSNERTHHSRIRRPGSPPVDYGSLDRRKNGSPRKEFHSTSHLENGPVHSRHRSYDHSYKRVQRKEAMYSKENNAGYGRMANDYRDDYQRYRPHSPKKAPDYDTRGEKRRPPNYEDHYGYYDNYREYRSQPSSARQSPYPQYDDYDHETYEAAARV
ncbi:partitioning defective 3 homolog isoform X3 [Antedon mediterranea]|uniref:partitioning defective 3 homolog isoform X3 n=1 Tax=Antedon mediterranea TaxID=105859 RepID=UPI003AF833BE